MPKYHRGFRGVSEMGSRRGHLEPLEVRQVLSASIAAEVLNPDAFRGENLYVSWQVDRSVVDLDADTVIEAHEVADLRLSFDALGVLQNAITFTPELGVDAFVSPEEHLTGIATLPIPESAPLGGEVQVWLTVEQTLPEQINQASGVSADGPNAAAPSNPFFFVKSVPSLVRAIVGERTSNAEVLSEFAQRFNTLGGGNPIGWLTSYVGSLHPQLVDSPGTSEYLVASMARQAIANDKATLSLTSADPNQLHNVVDSVLYQAYGDDRVQSDPWDPHRPTIILVHGVATNPGFHQDIGARIRSSTPDANVISFSWGYVPLGQGLLRTVDSLIKAADDFGFEDYLLSLLPGSQLLLDYHDGARAALRGPSTSTSWSNS